MHHVMTSVSGAVLQDVLGSIVVVEDRATAVQVAKELAQVKSTGYIRCLVLEELQVQKVNHSRSSVSREVHRLCDLVECDQRMSGVLEVD